MLFRPLQILGSGQNHSKGHETRQAGYAAAGPGQHVGRPGRLRTQGVQDHLQLTGS